VAVEILVTVILKIDPSGSVLTSTHLAAVKLAYETDSIDSVLRLVKIDTLSFPRPTGGDSRPLCDPDLEPSYYVSQSLGLTSKLKHDTVLEYELLSGLIFMSQRDWTRAMESLEKVVTHPVKDKAVSKIMVEAYKKWVLVGVLRTGRPPTLPALTSAAAKQSYGTLANPYTQLAAVFTNEDPNQLLADIAANSEIWTQDRNEGLVQELLAYYQRWQIINLREVYRQVSISKIREVTVSATSGQPLPDNEGVLGLVQGMLESAMFRGELSPAEEEGDGEHYLTFHDDASLITEANFASELSNVQTSITTLAGYFKQANDRLSSTRDYALYAVREQKRAEKEGIDAAYDNQGDDEDLMSGVVAND
jgi:COP9 signalosome complex subunit 3